jgi:FAD/FMN-containing dehydrogenase
VRTSSADSIDSRFSRRDFLRLLSLGGSAALFAGCRREESVLWVNDVHSRLTPTRVSRIFRPGNRAELLAELRRSLGFRGGISLAGGRHSMGAQAFGTDSLHFDLTGVNRVGDLDSSAGIIEVEPGAYWPDLMQALEERQAGAEHPWCIRQKQTGADQLTLGGALSANIHGRGLTLAPFVEDIESFRLLTATGEEITCSRTSHPDWFALAIGGYGLFGVVTSIRLRLMRRQVLRRVVAVETLERIPDLVEERIRDGFLYGDFQFSTAPETDGFLQEGVFSSYQPVEESLAPPDPTPIPAGISTEMWRQLITLAHFDKVRAFEVYKEYYRKTDGQVYASDRQQMSTYLPDYHEVIASAAASTVGQSLVITELYVPRNRLLAFMDAVREDLRKHAVDLVYGVVRWIEPDRETFLPWAQGAMACVIFNLNVRHDTAGRRKAAEDFRRLIDRALEQQGSFYLTYHSHATREQVETAYPNFADFLAQKQQRDPREIWRSDWCRHYQRLFATT